MCESFSIDFKKFGIDVTTIAPGFIDTPLTRKNKHPMPFLMDSKKAAIKISRAIDKKKSLYIFPENEIPNNFVRKDASEFIPFINEV